MEKTAIRTQEEGLDSEKYMRLMSEEEDLDTQIQAITAELDNFNISIMHERHGNRMLQTDRNWLLSRQKQEGSSDIGSLTAKLKEEETKLKSLQALKREAKSSYEKARLGMLRDANPKLYMLTTKVNRFTEKNKTLKSELGNLQNERAQISKEYSKIIHSFSSEEKVKQQLKDLEASYASTADITRDLSDLYVQLCKQSEQMERDLSENVEHVRLYEKLQKVKGQLEEVRKTNNELSLKTAGIDNELLELKENASKLSGDTPKSIRSEMRRLEHEITQSTQDIKAKERKKMQIQCEVDKLKEQAEELAKNNPSLPSRPSIPAPYSTTTRFSPSPKWNTTASPYLSAMSRGSPYKSLLGSSMSKKKKQKIPDEEVKRTQIVQQVGQTLHSGQMNNLPNALKTIGKPGEGMGSKLIQLNRVPKESK